MFTFPNAENFRQLSMWVLQDSCFFTFSESWCLSVTPVVVLAASQPANQVFRSYQLLENPQLYEFSPLVETCLMFKFGLGGPNCFVANLSSLLHWALPCSDWTMTYRTAQTVSNCHSHCNTVEEYDRKKKLLLFPLGDASPDCPCEQTAHDENTIWPA